jgi:cation diffusion facilitator CzcD-associated flavoprotein CzcO
VNYVWTSTTSGNWSTGTNWQSGAAPTSTRGASVQFYTGQTLAGATATATNDIAGVFQMNNLTLAGTNGTGATTATIVPAMAGAAKHITVLQRSPTYFWTGRNANELADTLRELEIDETWIHEIVRRKLLHDQQAVTQLARDEPEFLKTELLNNIKTFLPEGYDVETHFTPTYRPWQQRLAFVPDGDLFEGIKAGKATMVTDEIETFTETGVRLKSGRELSADLVITAISLSCTTRSMVEARAFLASV